MKKGVLRGYSWRVKRIILWIVIAIFILLIPTIVVMCYVFRHVKYMGVDDHVNYPLQNVYKASDYKLEGVEHTIRTDDDEELWCSEISVEIPKGVIIYLGAMKEPSVTYFYPHAELMKELGYASFLLEVRSHGESSGRKLGLGFTEVEDVRALVKYVKSVEKYKDVPIVLHGISLGGSIAINSVAQIPEVDGCIAMSPFASPDDQLELHFKSRHVPAFLTAAQRPFTHQAFRWIFGKEAADQKTSKELIKKIGDKPVLVIAAREDPSVSVENSYILQKASEKAEFWFRDTADHYIITGNDLRNVKNDKEYRNYVEAFILKIVEEKAK